MAEHGWVEFFSHEHGRCFWKDEATAETTWEMPAAVANALPEDARCWRKYFSREHGNFYWHNQDTGEFAWSEPRALFALKTPAEQAQDLASAWGRMGLGVDAMSGLRAMLRGVGRPRSSFGDGQLRSPFPKCAYEDVYTAAGEPLPVVQDSGGVDRDPAATMNYLAGKLKEGRDVYFEFDAVSAGAAVAWLARPEAPGDGDPWPKLHTYAAFAFPDRTRAQGDALSALAGAAERDEAILRSDERLGDDATRAEFLLLLALRTVKSDPSPRSHAVERFARAVITLAADCAPVGTLPLVLESWSAAEYPMRDYKALNKFVTQTEVYAKHARNAATARIEAAALAVALGGRPAAAKPATAWYGDAVRRAEALRDAVPYSIPKTWTLELLRATSRFSWPLVVHVCDTEGCSCPGGWLYRSMPWGDEIGANIKGDELALVEEALDTRRRLKSVAAGSDEAAALRASLKAARVALLDKGIREQVRRPDE